MVMGLTAKQSRFVNSYKELGDATKSAISAGYAPKSAYVEGSRLLKNVKVLAEIQQWKAKKSTEITKEDFVDLALKDYKELEVTEANKPRFLDIAGKALGYLGVEKNSPSQINNSTINILSIDTNNLSQEKIWDKVRSLIENNPQ